MWQVQGGGKVVTRYHDGGWSCGGHGGCGGGMSHVACYWTIQKKIE
jgi:hypothetical protein